MDHDVTQITILTASRTGSSVASLLRLFVATLTEVISASVDNQGTLDGVR